MILSGTCDRVARQQTYPHWLALKEVWMDWNSSMENTYWILEIHWVGRRQGTVDMRAFDNERGVTSRDRMDSISRPNVWKQIGRSWKEQSWREHNDGPITLMCKAYLGRCIWLILQSDDYTWWKCKPVCPKMRLQHIRVRTTSGYSGEQVVQFGVWWWKSQRRRFYFGASLISCRNKV